MARFNRKSVSKTKTTNLAGGEAYKQTDKAEFVSILLTSFVQDQYYRSATDTMNRIQELAAGITDKKFLAKAALYARTKFGMRSISHVAAREVARVSGEQWTKNFFEKIVHRPDDMLEIAAYYLKDNGGFPLPNAMKKGFRNALTKLDAYRLAKYRGENKDVKMIDIVNLVHPKSSTALKDLVAGVLKNTQTWEAKLSEAGQEAETEEEKAELKGKAWKEMVLEGKLGHFALLRNLRNIEDQAPEVLPQALEQLVEPDRIHKSLVLPFRYQTAMGEVSKNPTKKALNKALDIAVDNVPKLDGKTLVVLDKSGSMDGQPLEIGSLFAAVLAKSNDADMMVFATDAAFVSYNPDDTVSTIAKALEDNDFSGGTDFNAIFRELNASGKVYDRIVILSDMQGWVGYYAPTSTFDAYKKATGSTPKIYSFDLTGHGTLQFPRQDVYEIAGFSEKVFDIIKLLEQDKNALVNEIESVEL
jgi:60 kDa SS-A/Ro ribonucleoprotein